MTILGRRSAPLLILLAVATAGCGDDPTDVEFQVIATTTFDASLDIDLTMMTELASGVYIEDIVVGTGDPVDWGANVSVGYAGFLSDGAQFDAGEFPFELGGTGPGSPILGFHEGVRGMRLDGQRKIIIPPDLAYGSRSVNTGAVVIPAGAILVFDLELLEVN